MKTQELSERKLAYLLVLPSFILILGLVIYPLFYSFYLSMTSRSLLDLSGRFIGFNNYFSLFHDPKFVHSVWNTVYFTIVSLAIQMTLGMAIALLLNLNFRGKNLMRTIVLIPWAIPTIVNAVMWQWIYNPNYGALNGFLVSLGLIDSYKIWLGTPLLAMNMVILADTWRMTPLYVIMFLAGLQTIPKDLYEAAEIDGAGSLKRFRFVTLPLMKPMILVVLVLRTMQTFRVFDIIYILTNGGPADGTMVLTYLAYSNSFKFLNFGYGSAVSFLIALIIIVISFFYIRALRTESF